MLGRLYWIESTTRAGSKAAYCALTVESEPVSATSARSVAVAVSTETEASSTRTAGASTGVISASGDPGSIAQNVRTRSGEHIAASYNEMQIYLEFGCAGSPQVPVRDLSLGRGRFLFDTIK